MTQMGTTGKLPDLVEAAAGLAVLADAQDAASLDELLTALGRLTQALADAGHPVAATACRDTTQTLTSARAAKEAVALAAALQAVSQVLTRIQAAVREGRDLGPAGVETETPAPSGQPAAPDPAQAAPPPQPYPAATRTLAQPGRYLVFRLGREEFGLEILKVQEIVNLMDITRVPHTPVFLKGVSNLRGQVIPVVDWRLKFDMEEAPATDKTCMIVAKVSHHGKPVIIATLVDEVAEVLDFTAEALEPAPAFGAAVYARFLSGMGKMDRRIVMLLDVERVLSLEELTGRIGDE
jgi:purine-binding chemotaxis protein CheW